MDSPSIGSSRSTFRIAIARLHAGPETVRALARTLSADELRRAARYRFDRDRLRFIVARARLRQLLAKRLRTRPEAVELVYGAHGKPALAQRSGHDDWRFNLSHSDDLAVYALCLGREVGIDVEAVRVVRDADAIAAGFLSPFERQAYLGLDPGDKVLGFLNCWTRKEAFLKALGNGLARPLDSFDVSLAPGQPAGIVRVDATPGRQVGWHLDSFCPLPGFVAAVVTEQPGSAAVPR